METKEDIIIVELTIKDLYSHLLHFLLSREKIRAVLRAHEDKEDEIMGKIEELKEYPENASIEQIKEFAFDDVLWDLFEGEPYPIYASHGAWTVKDILGIMRIRLTEK